jgi:head-tail adaptor
MKGLPMWGAFFIEKWKDKIGNLADLTDKTIEHWFSFVINLAKVNLVSKSKAIISKEEEARLSVRIL